MAGAAPGSSEQSRTRRSESFSVSGALAAGTSSRSAMTSHSDGSPAKGRPTKAVAAPPGAPWQAL